MISLFCLHTHTHTCDKSTNFTAGKSVCKMTINTTYANLQIVVSG